MKFPYTGELPTPDMGGLLGMPALTLTEEDKKKALQQMLMNAGMQMAAASLSGARNGQALGMGLLGGVQGYQQGLMAPQQRLEAYKQQLDVQGKQLANAKAYDEVTSQKNMQSLMGQLSNTTASPFQYGLGPLSMNTPEMKMLNRSAQAEMTRDPAFLAQLMASGVKGADLNSFASRFDPQKRDAGSYYDNPITGTREFMPTLPHGMTSQNGVITNAEGYLPAMQNRTLAEKAAETMAELERRKLIDPVDVNKAGAIAGAEAGARDNYGFQQIQGPNGQPVFMTNPQARNQAQGNQFPGYRVPPDVQAQRDNVAREIYSNEGRPGQFSTRLNDNPGAGLAPQVAGIQGANPVVQDAKKAVNASWIEKTYQPLIDAGAASQATLDNIKGLRNLGLKTGAGTETLGALANWGAAFGVPKAEQYANNVQRFRSLAMENVNKELNLAKGPQTDQDAARAQSIFAQLNNTPQANQFLLDYREAVERYKQRAAAFHQDGIAIASNTGDLSEVSRRWRKVAGSIWDDPIMQKWERRK